MEKRKGDGKTWVGGLRNGGTIRNWIGVLTGRKKERKKNKEKK